MKYAIIAMLFLESVAAAADDDASKKLLKDLEGSYELTSLEFIGKTLTGFDLRAYEGDIKRITFTGNQRSMTYRDEFGELQTTTTTIKVNAAKTPAHFDEIDDHGEMKPGIISVKGDTIKICFYKFSSKSDEKRPTEFKSTPDGNCVMFTLKKIKE